MERTGTWPPPTSTATAADIEADTRRDGTLPDRALQAEVEVARVIEAADRYEIGLGHVRLSAPC
jgi:hypothetical protein